MSSHGHLGSKTVTTERHLRDALRLALSQMLAAASDPVEILHTAEQELLNLLLRDADAEVEQTILKMVEDVIAEFKDRLRCH